MSNTADKQANLASVREGRSVATLILVMALVFVAYFGVALAIPVLPPHVHQALASLPASSAPPAALVCDATR